MKTLSDLAQRWYARKLNRGYARSTLEFWRNHLDKFILPDLGPLTLERANTVKAIERAADKWAAEVSPRTAGAVLTTLTSILTFGIRAGSLQQNMAAIAERPRTKPGEGSDGVVDRHKVYSKDELRRLMFAAPSGSMERALLLCLGLTGMRIGEILGLHWCDVDLEDRGSIRVSQALDEPRHEGTGFQFKPVKSRAGRRQFDDFPRAMVHDLRLWKLRCPYAELVFCSSDGSPLYRKATWLKLRRLTKKAGLFHLSHHGLRHTFASLLLLDGENDLEVSYLLGHSDSTITRRVYAHFRGEAKAVSKLGDSILGGSKNG